MDIKKIGTNDMWQIQDIGMEDIQKIEKADSTTQEVGVIIDRKAGELRNMFGTVPVLTQPGKVNYEVLKDKLSPGSEFATVLTEKASIDIYEVMQALAKLFQEERRAGRELRHAQHRLFIAEINKEVSDIKKQAWTAFITGFVSAGISLAQGIASFRAAAKTFRGARALQQNQQKIQEFEGQIQQKQLELQQTKGDFQQKQQEVQNLQNKIQKTEQELQELKSKPKENTELIQQKEQQIQRLKSDLEQKQGELRSIENQIQRKEQEIQSLKQDIDQTKTNIDKKSLELEKERRSHEAKSLYFRASESLVHSLGEGSQKLFEADAKQHEALAEIHKTKAEDAHEWMQNMRELMRDVFEKLQSIQQSEVETSKNIFRV